MASISIDWVKVSPSRVTGRLYDVYWGVSPLQASPSFVPWFNIEGSATEIGPWVPLLDTPVRADFVLGVGRTIFSASSPVLVRLSIAPSEAGEAVQWSRPYFPGHNFKGNDFLLYRESLRKEILALEKLSGFPAYLIKRIRGGFSCPDCADEILGGAASPVDGSGTCGMCFGTGIYGGYHRPQPILADWSSRPTGSGTQGRTPNGRTEDEQIQPVHIYAYPTVATDDILVDAGTGKRFLVNKIEPVLWKIHTVAQDLSVGLLPLGHPAYLIPVAGIDIEP